MRKHRLQSVCLVSALVIVLAASFVMAVYRAKGCLPLANDAAMLAGRLSFINGTSVSADDLSDTSTEPPPARPLSETPTEESAEPEHPKNTVHSGESHPVAEVSVNNGNESCDNFTIRNTTGLDMDFDELLNSDLPFDVEDNRTVQVLVYHTHTCESYLDEDSSVYYDSFYPRSTDGSQGVMAVGERLVETLRRQGIGAVHDTTLHDYPSYEGSYARSWETIQSYAEKYPNIKVTIDLHRDSMTADDGTKYKPTFVCGGDKAAQIMIMSGCDPDGDFDFWRENLIFALKLQNKCEDMYPGMTRPLNFGEFTYNMNFNNGSLLIEVGTDANTVEEASRSGEYLANALSSLLLNE